MHPTRITLLLYILLCIVSITSGQDAEDSFEASSLQERIRETSRTLNVPELAQVAEQNAIIWIEKIQYSMDNAYDQRGLYYLAIQVSLANASQVEQVFASDDIKLVCGQQPIELRPGKIPVSFASGPLRVAGKLYARQQLTCPEKVTLQSGQGQRIWMLFAGLPARSQLGKLRLIFAANQQREYELNIKRQCSLRLGMDYQRIGPLQAIGLMHIRGELNPINVDDVANQLFRSSIDGTSRFVVTLPKSESVDVDIANWLLTGAGDGRANPLFRRFPSLPEVRYLALTGISEERRTELEFEPQAAGVFDSDLNAVHMALGDICSRVPGAELLNQIQHGHPLARQAILRWNGKYLGTAAWPQLQALMKSENGTDRSSALVAAGHQPSSKEMLSQLFKDDPKSVMQGLLQADNAQSLGLAQAFMRESNLTRNEQLDLIGNHYRPEWNDILLQAVADKDPATRSKALRVLSETGHPQLLEILSHDLEDEDSDVRDEAFRILASRSDAKSFEIAVDAALRRFSSGDLTDAVLDIARKSRDPRFAEPMRNHLQKEHPLRGKLIELLEYVGDSEAMRIAMSQFDELRNTEKIALLGVLIELPMPGRLELAAKAFQSESLAVIDAGSELLETIGNDEAVEVINRSITSMDDETSNETFARHIRALARIANPAASELLKNLRLDIYKKKDATRVRLIRAALKYVETLSPAANSIDSAAYYMRVKQWPEARRHFALANRIDPTQSSGWANMGHISLRESTTDQEQGEAAKAKKKIEQAKGEFSKAMSIDPYDGYAVTGLGIALAQLDQPTEGIQLVTEAAERFPFDNVYEYNTACVYGRAIESLQQDQDRNGTTISKLKSEGLKHLKSSLELGFNDFDLLQDDPDLDPLRDHPEFENLLKESVDSE